MDTNYEPRLVNLELFLLISLTCKQWPGISLVVGRERTVELFSLIAVRGMARAMNDELATHLGLICQKWQGVSVQGEQTTKALNRVQTMSNSTAVSRSKYYPLHALHNRPGLRPTTTLLKVLGLSLKDLRPSRRHRGRSTFFARRSSSIWERGLDLPAVLRAARQKYRSMMKSVHTDRSGTPVNISQTITVVWRLVRDRFKEHGICLDD